MKKVKRVEKGPRDDGSRWAIVRDGKPVYRGPGLMRADAERIAEALLEPADVVCLGRPDVPDFLREWDEAITEARETGRPVFVWRSWFSENGAYNLRPVARTRHPAFMGGPVPKHDPERDQ